MSLSLIGVVAHLGKSSGKRITYQLMCCISFQYHRAFLASNIQCLQPQRSLSGGVRDNINVL